VQRGLLNPQISWVIGPTWTAGSDPLRHPPGESQRGKQHGRKGEVQWNRQAVRSSRPGWHGEGCIASTPVSNL